MSFVLRRFCKVHRYKEGEDHRLYKSDEHFEKVEWYDGKLTNGKEAYFDETWQPNHHTYQDNSSKYISEKTKWECEYSYNLSNSMEPSDDDTDDFFYDIFSMKMKSKVTNIPKESTETNHDKVWESYHDYCHTECCIDISIDRSEVVVKSWEKSKHPIEEKAVEICTKDVDKDTSDKPETFIEGEIVTKKRFEKRFHMLHNEEACCVYKASLALTSWEENSRTNHYNNDKHPCWEHSICNCRQEPTFRKCMRWNRQDMWCVMCFHVREDYRWNFWIARAKKEPF